MRCQILNSRPLGAVLYDVPHNPLGYAISPGLACSANTPKHVAIANASGAKPGIDSALDPIRNRHRPNMSGLADQIDDGPVVFPPLKMGNVQFCRLFAAQPATQEDSEQRPIPLALKRIRVKHLPERSCLIGSEPVPQTDAEVLRPFDSPDAGGKVRAEQAGISGFICEASNGREPAVDRPWRKLTRLQVNSIAGNNGFVER